jgi:hypothetical protein
MRDGFSGTGRFRWLWAAFGPTQQGEPSSTIHEVSTSVREYVMPNGMPLLGADDDDDDEEEAMSLLDEYSEVRA